MAEQEIGNLAVRVGLDTAEFNRGVKELSQRMQIISQDFKNASGGLDKVGDAAEISRLRITKLTSGIDEQKKIVDQFRIAHQKATDQFGEGSKKALDYELKLKKAEGALQSMERQLVTSTAELKRQESAFTALGTKMSSISKSCTEFGAKMKDVGKSLTMTVTAPILAAGVASAKLASDLSENMNKVDVAFKGNAQEVKDWSGTTLKSFGISQGSALEMSSLFGDMGTAMGQSTSEASKMSTGLVGLAGDLASFKNIGIAQAQDALKGIFTGEGESLKSLGIIMQDSTLKAFALATGQKKSYEEMTQAEKVALRYAFVMDATKNSQGDFARTSEGTANQTRIFGETMKELGANVGQYLLPVITPLITKLSEMAQKFGELSPQTQKTILVVAGLAAAIGPVLIVGGAMVTGFSAIAGAVGVASTAIAAAGGVIAVLTGPIGIAILAITAIIAIGILLYKNWDVIKAKAQELGKKLSEIWTNIKTFTIDTWNSIKDGISNTVTGIRNAIVNGITVAIDWIKSLPNEAFQWGNDMIMGIVKGIKNAAYAVGNAVKGIAQNIRSFLHFSVPDQGPLVDFESWMPDFMGGLAKGIDANKYKVTDAIRGLTGNMSINANVSGSSLNGVGSSVTNSSQVINYEGIFKGAIINVRSDNDIKQIAKELYSLQRSRSRGQGVTA